MLASIHTHPSAQCSRVDAESLLGRTNVKEPVICAVQHSGRGAFRSALRGEKRVQQQNSAFALHCVLICNKPAAHFVTTLAWESEILRPKVNPRTHSVIKEGRV